MAKAPKTTEAPAPAPEMAGAPGEIVKVRGPEDGRWRAGIQFGPIEREIDLGEITAEDWAEIEADAHLEKRPVAPAQNPPAQAPAPQA